MRGLLSMAVVGIAIAIAGCSELMAEEPAGLTLEEARTVSVKDLARRVLGDVGGALVVSVERERLPDAPRLFDLTFFTQTEGSWSTGVCEQTVIEVEFGEKNAAGRQFPSSIVAERRYGATGSAVPAVGEAHAIRQGKDDEACRAMRTPRDFFAAPDNLAAHMVIWHFENFREAAKRPALGFKFECRDQQDACREPSRYLAELRLSEIASVKEIPCGPIPAAYPNPECYEVELGMEVENGRRVSSLRGGVLRIYGTTFMNDMRIYRVTLDRTMGMN